jgi:hypothetical protein
MIKTEEQTIEVWITFRDCFGGIGVYLESDPNQKAIYAKDALRFLQIDIFNKDVDLHDVYSKLQPLLNAERAERLKKYQPVAYRRISIPQTRSF